MGWWRSFCDWHTVKTFLGVGWTSEYPTKMVIKLCRYIHIGSVMHLLGRHPQKKLLLFGTLPKLSPPLISLKAPSKDLSQTLSFNHMYVSASFVIQRHNIFAEGTRLQQKSNFDHFFFRFPLKKTKARQLFPFIFYFAEVLLVAKTSLWEGQYGTIHSDLELPGTFRFLPFCCSSCLMALGMAKPVQNLKKISIFLHES